MKKKSFHFLFVSTFLFFALPLNAMRCLLLGGGDCFEQNSCVELKSGELIKVKDLKKGQKVVSGRDHNGNPCYNEISRISPTQQWNALQILIRPELGDDKVSLILTDDHYLYATRFPSVRGSLVKKTAGELTTDDFLLYKGKLTRILSLTKISYDTDQIMYSPFTSNESIEVNGIYCNCRSKLKELDIRLLFY